MNQHCNYEILKLQDEYYLHDTKIFSYYIEYLKFNVGTPGFEEINFKNENQAKKRQGYAVNTLYGNAVQSYLRGNSGLPYEYSGTVRITENDGTIISGYLDEYIYTGGAHGGTFRIPYTHDGRTGEKKNICDFMSTDDCQRCIIDDIINQIETGGQSSLYFPNYKDLVKQSFNTENFYVTPQGVVVFFKQYDIAPYSSGIRTFIIPFNAC